MQQNVQKSCSYDENCKVLTEISLSKPLFTLLFSSFATFFHVFFGDLVYGLKEIVQMSKNVVEGDSNNRSYYYCSFFVVCGFPARSSNKQLSLDFLLP